VTKVESRGNLAAHLGDDLLDEEAAEADAGKPALAIADRIEHTAVVARFGLDRPRALVARMGAIPAGMPRVRRDLDEDQGLVDQRRMKERVASAGPADRCGARKSSQSRIWCTAS